MCFITLRRKVCLSIFCCQLQQNVVTASCSFADHQNKFCYALIYIENISICKKRPVLPTPGVDVMFHMFKSQLGMANLFAEGEKD